MNSELLQNCELMKTTFRKAYYAKEIEGRSFGRKECVEGRALEGSRARNVFSFTTADK